MLLEVDKSEDIAYRVRGSKLSDFGLDERAFQNIIFRSLDKLIPDDELLLIMQSRRWQEEPDLMAIDKAGRLYIFELKVWESRSENILQVLRYGQIYGNYDYESLERFFKKFDGESRTLKEAHEAVFGIALPIEAFNCSQVFVVMTNGVDFKTREAIQYWRKQNLQLEPWIYRVYEGSNDQMLIEMSTYTSIDNPYEDISEGYQVLNTNRRNSVQDHESMLSEKIAAAYFSPWKNKINNLSKGDVVFLYQSGTGIVAVGKASGKLERRPYHGDPLNEDEEFYMKLNQFHLLKSPITASEMKEITGVNHRFLSTMFGIDSEAGKSLYKAALNR